jgi:hypothetical protein
MPNMPEGEIAEKELSLTKAIENLLPEFVKSCRENSNVVVLHQDGFAVHYQDDEYKLLGMAIKFAGLYRKRSPYHREERRNGQAAKKLARHDRDINAGTGLAESHGDVRSPRRGDPEFFDHKRKAYPCVSHTNLDE